jgi:hypothetical protein
MSVILRGIPSITGVRARGNVFDPANTLLLLKGNGANNGTVFPDSSIYNATITSTGSIITSTDEFKYYGSSILDTSGYLTTPNTSLYGLGTGNFTIQAWTYRTASQAYAAIIDFRQPGGDSQAKPTLMIFDNNLVYRVLGDNRITVVGGPPASVWNHIAIVKNNNLTTMYVNGLYQGDWADTTDYGASNDIVIGGVGDTRGYPAFWPGYLQDVSVANVAQYTAAFTPPGPLA